jgi:hypothetical protein
MFFYFFPHDRWTRLHDDPLTNEKNPICDSHAPRQKRYLRYLVIETADTTWTATTVSVAPTTPAGVRIFSRCCCC